MVNVKNRLKQVFILFALTAFAVGCAGTGNKVATPTNASDATIEASKAGKPATAKGTESFKQKQKRITDEVARAEAPKFEMRTVSDCGCGGGDPKLRTSSAACLE